MILIKDRHIDPFWMAIAKAAKGNMILIKDRHNGAMLDAIGLNVGNMILIKDRHSKPEPMFIASI